MGRFLNLARKDAKRITTNGGFEVDINLTSKSPPVVSATVQGTATRHSIGYDSDGNLVKTSNVHLAISEQVFQEISYPYKDSNGDTDLRGHLVNYIDSSGSLQYYKVETTLPDDTIGLIILILSRAQNNG